MWHTSPSYQAASLLCIYVYNEFHFSNLSSSYFHPNNTIPSNLEYRRWFLNDRKCSLCEWIKIAKYSRSIIKPSRFDNISLNSEERKQIYTQDQHIPTHREKKTNPLLHPLDQRASRGIHTKEKYPKIEERKNNKRFYGVAKRWANLNLNGWGVSRQEVTEKMRFTKTLPTLVIARTLNFSTFETSPILKGRLCVQTLSLPA